MREIKELFKEHFIKGSTVEAVSEMRTKRIDWAEECHHPLDLVTTSGGGYVVCNEDGRLDDFPDTYFYDGDSPKKKDVLDLFNSVIEFGIFHFKIVWQSDVRYWDTHADKFNRDCPAEHGNDGTDTTLLQTY